MGLQSEFNTKREYKKNVVLLTCPRGVHEEKNKPSANSSSIHKQMTLMNRFFLGNQKHAAWQMQFDSQPNDFNEPVLYSESKYTPEVVWIGSRTNEDIIWTS